MQLDGSAEKHLQCHNTDRLDNWQACGMFRQATAGAQGHKERKVHTCTSGDKTIKVHTGMPQGMGKTRQLHTCTRGAMKREL